MKRTLCLFLTLLLLTLAQTAFAEEEEIGVSYPADSLLTKGESFLPNEAESPEFAEGESSLPVEAESPVLTEGESSLPVEAESPVSAEGESFFPVEEESPVSVIEAPALSKSDADFLTKEGDSSYPNEECPVFVEGESSLPDKAEIFALAETVSTPNEPMPGEATAQEATPGVAAVQEAAPGEATAQETAPGEATAQEAMPGIAAAQESMPGVAAATPSESIPAQEEIEAAFAQLPTEGDESPEAPVESPLRLSAGTDHVNRSASLKLTLTYNGETVSASKAKWKSSNAAVASVSSGRVSAKKQGTAVISATYQGETAEFTVTVVQPVTGVKLSPAALQVDAGATAALKGTVSPSNADDQTLVWKSSNAAVATVDENGVVTGVSGGTVTVTATSSNGKSAKVKVKVIQPVTGVVIPETLTVTAKKYANLSASVLPANATDKKLTWTTSNKKVATVSNGRVTGVAGGECVITARASGGIVAQCAVTVIQPASSVKLGKSSVNLDAGATYALSAAVSPSTATDKSVVWRSANAAIASVDENGAVTGIAGGTVKITAETANGKKASCTVTVIQPVSEISLPEAITVNARASKTVSAAVLPATATSKKLTWTTSNKRVATVSSSGKVTGVAGGECVVTAKAANGVTASVKVTVIQPVSSVKLSKTSLSLDMGSSFALRATVSPKNATDPSVVWHSSNAGVASVDENGVVTGISAGKAVITAESANGKKHTASVTVTRPVESVELSSAATVSVKKTVTLKAVALPENASGRKIVWSSSNPKIASVSSSGAVKGVSAGECVITAKTANGVFAECCVTVIQPVTSVKMSQSSATVSLFGAFRLTATAMPANANDRAVSWTSSDSRVASVDETGLVTGVGGGNATVTALSSSGVKATCRITVKEVKPSSVTVDTRFLTLNPGASSAIHASVSPSNASDPRLVFQSADPNVATVDENGVVTGVGIGRTTVTVSALAKDGLTASVTVSVIQEDASRLEGVIVGINPGHQTRTIYQKYPIAPNSGTTAYGCKVGASGDYTGIPEYVTNREISLKVRDLLEEAGATVVMTRTEDDVYLTNIERAQILNEAKVDIALQVHCNSDGNHKNEGLSCYIRTTGDYVDESRACATALSNEMSKATGAVNLGVKICNTYMSLNWTTTPSVLLEMGYLSNKKEDLLLNDDSYQNRMAAGIFEGLCVYFDR